MAKAPEPLPPEVLAAFERRQPIEAIKLLIKLRAAGAARAASRTTPPPQRAKPQPEPPASRAAPPGKGHRGGLSPGEVPRSGSTVWLLVVAALLAYAAFRLFRT